MDGFKPLIASKTFWGALISVAAGLLNVFGVPIDHADQGLITDAVTGTMSTVGGLIAVWGRISAKKRIG